MNLSQTYNNVASKEVLLDPSENRLALFPIKFQEIWDEYEKQQAAFWTSGEIDFSADLTDFQKT